MLLLFGVFTVIVISVNAAFIHHSNNSLDNIADLIISHGGTLKKNGMSMGIGPENNRKSEMHLRLSQNKELSYSARYFTVFLDKDKNIKSINLEKIASVTDDQARVYTTEIIDKERSEGWADHYRFKLEENDNEYILVFLDGSNARNSVISLFLITSLTAAFAYIIIFILVSVISHKVIRPIAESYEKQKQFITDAGHELKTPLTVISANTEIIEMTYGENEWTQGISKQSERMKNLISRMITLSRMDEETTDTVFMKFNLSEAVFDTVSAFNAGADLKNIHLNTDIENNILYTGDEGMIRQLIAIFTDNAVKYCKSGETTDVTLKKVHSLGSDKTKLVFSNVYEENQKPETDKLFDRFYRGDKSHKSSNSFGLGLSIASSIARIHDIDIKVKLTDNNTITFELLFPNRNISQ